MAVISFWNETLQLCTVSKNSFTMRSPLQLEISKATWRTLGFRSTGRSDPVFVSKGRVLCTALVGETETVRLNYDRVSTQSFCLVRRAEGWSPQDHSGRSWGALIYPSCRRGGERERISLLDCPRTNNWSLRNPDDTSMLTRCSLDDSDHLHPLCSPSSESVLTPAQLKVQIHGHSPRPPASGLPVADWQWLVQVWLLGSMKAGGLVEAGRPGRADPERDCGTSSGQMVRLQMGRRISHSYGSRVCIVVRAEETGWMKFSCISREGRSLTALPFKFLCSLVCSIPLILLSLFVSHYWLYPLCGLSSFQSVFLFIPFFFFGNCVLLLDGLFLSFILFLLAFTSFFSPAVAGFDWLVVGVLVTAAALQVGTEAFFTFAGHGGDNGHGQEVPGIQVFLGA